MLLAYDLQKSQSVGDHTLRYVYSGRVWDLLSDYGSFYLISDSGIEAIGGETRSRANTAPDFYPAPFHDPISEIPNSVSMRLAGFFERDVP